jgi:hypothetical protein
MATQKDMNTEPIEPSMEDLGVLPNNTNPNWIKDSGLRKLNLGIFFMYSTAASAGYIGNLVNSLLVLPECKCAVARSHDLMLISSQLVSSWVV